MCRVLGLSIALLAVIACGDDGHDPRPGTIREPEDAACAGRHCYDAKAYALEARFDWNTRALIATETVSLEATVDGGVLAELDSWVQVSRVHAGAVELAFDTPDPHTLRIDLRPLAATRAVTFTIDYAVGVSGALVAATP